MYLVKVRRNLDFSPANAAMAAGFLGPCGG
jgi:hypothetical protein